MTLRIPRRLAALIAFVPTLAAQYQLTFVG